MATQANPATGLIMASVRSSHSNRLVPLKSSFVSYGVGALKVPSLQIAQSNRLRCKSYGGGALGSQMNLFTRVARVFKSYINMIVSSFEDPEKILDQAVLDMNTDLIKMRQATAQVLASRKQIENRYKAAQQASDDWYRRAQLALGKGDEDLAREALKRRKSFSENANALKAQLDQQKGVVDNLVSNTRLLESKIQEAKSKKDVLKARAQSAKFATSSLFIFVLTIRTCTKSSDSFRTSTKVIELVGRVDTSSALEAFNKMEEKVLAMESEAEAYNELTADDLESKFQLLEGSSVDNDLESLRKEMSGRSQKGELPPGRTAVRSNTVFPYRESEIEMELNELRRKANDF